MYKPVMYDTKTLEEFGVVDVTPRIIKSYEKIQFRCKCGTIGEREFAEAKKSKRINGHFYQCKPCFAIKIKLRSQNPEWIKNLRAAANSPEHKARAIQNSINNVKKYFEKDIVGVIKKSGAVYEGDISSPGNTIKIIWPDGVTRSIRIRRFMVDGIIHRPKTGVEGFWHMQHLEQVEKLGLKVEKLDEKIANITYKGYTWQQQWCNHINTKCKRMIKNLDNAEKMEALLASGMPLNKVCKEVGVDPNRYYRDRRHGIGVKVTAVATRHMERLIEIEGGIYDRKLEGTKYRPDIRIEEAKLIIETDGMQWHSEEYKERNYHATRWAKLSEAGYRVLSFSEYEVKEKKDIVMSMINHRLGKSESISPKGLEIKVLTKAEADGFFEANHLKGKGQGEAIGLLREGVVYACLRYTDEKKYYNISRFACKNGCSIAGAYSRLLGEMKRDLPIVNFVDRRHGNGEHLLNLGFVKANVHIGFEWTDGYYHFNRRKFLGKSGYELGLKRFWDYGQVKYVLPKI